MKALFTEEERRELNEAVKLKGSTSKIDNAMTAAAHGALHALFNPAHKKVWGKHPEDYPGGSFQYSKDAMQLLKVFRPAIEKFYKANKDRFQ